MAGQLYPLYFFYQAELFPDYKTHRLALTDYFNHVACHVVILLKVGKSNQWPCYVRSSLI